MEARNKMATSKVVRIEKGFSNSAMAVPYAYAVLTCGHSADVKMRGQDLECFKCKTQYVHDGHSAKCPACGCTSALHIKGYPHPHKEADRLTKVGDEVECEECDIYTEQLKKLRALKPEDIQHARFRTYDSRGIGDGAYYLYKRDESSPTGVTLMFSVPATKEVDELLRAIRVAPISPTEPR